MSRKDLERSKLFTRRAGVIAFTQLGILGALATKLYRVQVDEGARYTTMAEANRVSARPIPPPRGRILDRFGDPLAANKSNWRAELVAEETPDIDTTRSLLGILHHRDVVLHPAMNIQEAIAVFDAAEAESLAVVEPGDQRRPIGILTEAHAMRRYAEESERRRREAVGEG